MNVFFFSLFPQFFESKKTNEIVKIFIRKRSENVSTQRTNLFVISKYRVADTMEFQTKVVHWFVIYLNDDDEETL